MASDSDEAEFVLPTVHLRQRHEWDCGVACALMVLGSMGRRDVTRDAFVGAAGVRGKPLWTVDILFALRALGVEGARMLTSFAGVRATHAGMEFYASDFADDERRVQARFEGAAALGHEVEERAAVGREELEAIVRGGSRVIALVDLRLLVCEQCGRAMPAEGGYMGHYVVVCGALPGGRVVYANPGVGEGSCVASADTFTAARRAAGTDDDLLVVPSV